MLFYPTKVFAYLSSRYVLGKRSPKGWYPMDCPFCGKERKGAAHMHIQIFKCWSCGAFSPIVEFIQQTEHVSEYDAKQKVWTANISGFDAELSKAIDLDLDVANKIESTVTLPDGWKPIHNDGGILSKRAYAYLSNRGFDIDALNSKGFGYCGKHPDLAPGDPGYYSKDFFGYIIIPFKRNDILAYYIGRDFIGNGLRYKNPPVDYVGVGKADVIYNERALSLYKSVFIVEGWSDAEALGDHGTATLGWNMSAYQTSAYIKSTASKLIFIPDAGIDDASGQSYYQKAVQQAMQFIDSDKKIFVVDLNVPELDKYKTASGKRAKDVCEIGADVVIDRFRQHTKQLDWNLAMEILTK